MSTQIRPLRSRLFVFDEPMRCYFCAHDQFIPYTTYINVEQPGIGVLHSRYVAICQQCGQARLFSDPSDYDPKTDTYIWALRQHILDLKKYKVKLMFYVSKRHDRKLPVFLDELQVLSLQVERVQRLKTDVTVWASVETLNEAHVLKQAIEYYANRLRITLKDVSVCK